MPRNEHVFSFAIIKYGELIQSSQALRLGLGFIVAMVILCTLKVSYGFSKNMFLLSLEREKPY